MSCSKIVNNNDKERFEVSEDWFAPIIKNVAENELVVNDNIWFALWIISCDIDNKLLGVMISIRDTDNIGMVLDWLPTGTRFVFDNNDKITRETIDIDNKSVNR